MITLVLSFIFQGNNIINYPLHKQAVAVALILFGMESGAALAAVVGVLVEVPYSFPCENHGKEQGKIQIRIKGSTEKKTK